jgi:hypothetical protein
MLIIAAKIRIPPVVPGAGMCYTCLKEWGRATQHEKYGPSVQYDMAGEKARCVWMLF